MSKKTWIAWGLFLLLPGLIGLGIQHAQNSALQSRIHLATQSVADNPVAKEYLEMYEEWSDLPANKKADNPWGYGLYGGHEIQRRLSEA